MDIAFLYVVAIPLHPWSRTANAFQHFDDVFGGDRRRVTFFAPISNEFESSGCIDIDTAAEHPREHVFLHFQIDCDNFTRSILKNHRPMRSRTINPYAIPPRRKLFSIVTKSAKQSFRRHDPRHDMWLAPAIGESETIEMFPYRVGE